MEREPFVASQLSRRNDLQSREHGSSSTALSRSNNALFFRHGTNRGERDRREREIYQNRVYWNESGIPDTGVPVEAGRDRQENKRIAKLNGNK